MAIMLAIEQATDTASIALLDGSNVLAERSWTSRPRERSRLFETISATLSESRVKLAEIETYVVGLGPGSYTGLRIAIASAMAFALPGKNNVYGLSSAGALAVSVMAETLAETVAVVGDARRKHLWLARFDSAHPPEAGGTFALARPEELRKVCPAGSVCVTPDWETIGAVLVQTLSGFATVIGEKRAPTASALGRLASGRMERGIPSEKLVPIYLHGAVDESKGLLDNDLVTVQHQTE